MMSSVAAAPASTRKGLFPQDSVRRRDGPPASASPRQGASSCACGGSCPRCRAGAAKLAVDKEIGGAPSLVEDGVEGLDHDIGGPDAGVPTPVPAPAAPTVTATTRTGPTYGSCRAFSWVVDWATTGRSGFIVQEITNTNTINGCDGTAQAAPSTPHYWEAWSVDSTGAVASGDQWVRAARPSTTGSWAMSGSASFVTTLDPAAHFSTTAVPDANGLMATTTAPGNLTNPAYTRSVSDSWDCCNGHNTHTHA
jgi:hypothetical protein